MISLVLGLQLLTSAGQAQDLRTSQITNLTNASQVQQFVRERKSEYFDAKDFMLTDSLSPDCTGYSVCKTSGEHVSWLKADFDGDNRLDLLVTGYRNSTSARRYVTCFLDLGEQKFTEIRLAAGGYNCDAAQLGYVGSKPVIFYTHSQIQGARFTENRKLICKQDTLVFRKNGFVEYNRTPRDYRIEKVVFSTDACYGTCPIFTLQLARNGAATYHAEQYNKLKGNFTTIVQAQPLAEIWTLLNYLNFPRLQTNYSIAATDHPTCTLTITYGGGKVKTITDYGERGTFGLGQVYELLFTLRTTQAWQKRQAH